MSERFKATINTNDSKNTRLPIIDEFVNYRFGRDAQAHLSRYQFVVEKWIELSKALKRPIRVLDVGCGDIYLARIFIASYQIEKKLIIERYAGVDVDDVSLARTKKHLPNSMNIEVHWIDFTVDGLKKFKDKEFDLVVNLEVLEHIKPEFVLPILKEFRRVADLALISTPNFKGGSGKLPDDHIKEWNIDELLPLMIEAGWEIYQTNGTFGHLGKMKKEFHKSEFLSKILSVLEPKCSQDLLSLCLAKFLPEMAQNYLYMLGDWEKFTGKKSQDNIL